MIKDRLLKQVKEYRQNCKQNDDKRDKNQAKEVKGVKRINNLQYGPDPKWNLLDIYLPENVSGKIPIIISIHGGGWIYGTKETYQFYGLNIAKNGFAFINANYQLGPEVKFPKELDQVNEYVHWVAENSHKYNLDTHNVFLMGDSAGGQMAEQYATALTNENYRKKLGYKLPNLKFRAIALNCPATFMKDEQMMAGLWSAYFDPGVMSLPENKDLIDVEKYITKDYLPTFIATSNKDFFRDCSIRLDGFLRAKRVEVVQKSWGTSQKPQYHVFMVDQNNKLGQEATRQELEFFKRHLAN